MKEFIQLGKALQEQANQLAEVHRQLAKDTEIIHKAARALNDPSIQALAQEMQTEVHRQLAKDAEIVHKAAKALNDPSIQALVQEMQTEVHRQLAKDAEIIHKAAKALNDPSIQALVQEMQTEAQRAKDDAFVGTNIREAWRILRGGK